MKVGRTSTPREWTWVDCGLPVSQLVNTEVVPDAAHVDLSLKLLYRISVQGWRLVSREDDCTATLTTYYSTDIRSWVGWDDVDGGS